MDFKKKSLSILFALVVLISPMFSITYAFADPEIIVGDGGYVLGYEYTNENGDTVQSNNYNEDVEELFKDIEKNSENSIRSIEGDLFQPILFKTKNDGGSIFITQEENEQRESINDAILNGDTSKKYSLYERFGGNLTFPRYYGEEVIRTNFADKVYTYLQSMDPDNSDVFSQISDIYDMLTRSDSVYRNNFYESRPELKIDGSDPRVILKNSGAYGDLLVSAEHSWANYFLLTAETIVYFTSAFAGNQFVDFVVSIPEMLFEGPIWEGLKGLFYIPIFLMGVFLIVFIIKKLPQALKGDFPLRAFLEKLLFSTLSLGLFSILVINPALFWDTTKKALSFGDEIINSSLNISAQLDPTLRAVVYTENDDSNSLEATLWCKSVFEPWVEGVFGKKYDELYTRYDNNGELITDVTPVYDEDGNIDYLKSGDKKLIAQGLDSAKSIGDFIVPLGKEDERNLAALAYSTSSFYHIDTEEIEKIRKEESADEEKDLEAEHPWPNTDWETTLASIYDDDFKWIDSMLNVGNVRKPADSDIKTKSPLGYQTETNASSEEELINSTHLYEFRGFGAGVRALFLSLLLLPILYLGVMKFIYVMKCAFSGLILLKNSFLNIINPENKQYNILLNLKNMVQPLLFYFWYLIIIFIIVILYEKIGTSENPLFNLLYLLIACYLCLSKPNSLKQDTRKLVAGFNSYIVNPISNRIDRAMETEFYKDLKDNIKNKAPKMKEDLENKTKDTLRKNESIASIIDNVDEKKALKKKIKENESIDSDLDVREKETRKIILKDIKDGNKDKYTPQFLNDHRFDNGKLEKINEAKKMKEAKSIHIETSDPIKIKEKKLKEDYENKVKERKQQIRQQYEAYKQSVDNNEDKEQ